MAFKRALWHSGLTYSQVCRRCQTQITYTDEKLDFRAWYADGFIYCPTCQTPLRHNEAYAIDRPKAPVIVDMTDSTQTTGTALFCTNCGRAFRDGEFFCPTCGKKR